MKHLSIFYFSVCFLLLTGCNSDFKSENNQPFKSESERKLEETIVFLENNQPEVSTNSYSFKLKDASSSVLNSINYRNNSNTLNTSTKGNHQSDYSNNEITVPPNYNDSYHNTQINYYTNTDGITVQSPTYYQSIPEDATAICRDGTYSFSLNTRGTCSRHGGVERWLK